jgi:hypothetical protein
MRGEEEGSGGREAGEGAHPIERLGVGYNNE